MVDTKQGFLSLPAAFLAVKPRGLNKTQTNHQLCQQSKNIVTVVNASKGKTKQISACCQTWSSVSHEAIDTHVDIFKPWIHMLAGFSLTSVREGNWSPST